MNFGALFKAYDTIVTLRDAARRLLRVHDLRAADALQLAAALAAAEGRPMTLTLLCLDDRLGAAAEREGFPVLGATARSHGRPG